VPIWAGTGVLSLAQGVGWVSDTTAPGQVGNFVIVGQRLGAGQPFIDLLDLDAGDQVVVETADHVYTYTLDVAPRDLTVNHTAAWVLDPVPGGEKLVPQRPLITLITAQDLLRTSDRSVGIGLLSDVRDR
jgi:sortase A